MSISDAEPRSPLMYGPQHEICKWPVKSPTIRRDVRNQRICVQWKGKAQDQMLPNVQIQEGAQFLFPILGEAYCPLIAKSMDSALIPFLDQVKNWPASPEIVKRMINTIGNSNPETWIVWIMNPAVTLEQGKILSLTSSVMLLSDDNCGIIVPEPFIDLSIRMKALDLFTKQKKV